MSYITFFPSSSASSAKTATRQKSTKKLLNEKFTLRFSFPEIKKENNFSIHYEIQLQFHRQNCKSCTKRMNAINKYNGSKANSKCFMYIDR